MLNRFHTRILRHLQLRESWVIFFILGIIMMNFPFLNIFNKPFTIAGFPLLFLYFTIGWGISIAVIYIFTLAIKPDDHPEKRNQRP